MGDVANIPMKCGRCGKRWRVSEVYLLIRDRWICDGGCEGRLRMMSVAEARAEATAGSPGQAT